MAKNIKEVQEINRKILDEVDRVCKKYNISELNPVGKDGCYTEGPWKGEFVHGTFKFYFIYVWSMKI